MISAAQCAPAEVIHLLAAIKSPKTDSEDLFRLDSLIAQGATFKIMDEGGAVVAAYVLGAYGSLLWVLAAAGKAKFDLTAAILNLLEQQGAGFDAVGFRTERGGLVRKALRHGYHVTKKENRAYFLRKNLRP
ncbi:hypothetical protein [Duganella sp. BJB476]|uniref:hypothetical protein n=1 Tax=Duganella sp. BJB476 TaxID=1871176 RepID=UPI000E34FD5F|nr:hypothetical protein [Duganella sp. BJB476]RFP36155.1 hypothetical protein D0T21_06895 [Duganella sp. BJB476]